MGLFTAIQKFFAGQPDVQKLPLPSFGNVFGLEGAQAATAGSILQLYAQNGYLRALVDTVGNGVSQTHWRVYKRVSGSRKAILRDYGLNGAGFHERQKAISTARADSELVEVPNHPFLSMLANPNEHFTGGQTLKLLQAHLDLAGECFLLLSRDTKGKVTGFVPLPASCVSDTPSAGRDYFQVGYESLTGQIASSEILWFKHPNPATPLRRGAGLGIAVADELNASEAIASAIRAAMKRNGLPVAIVGVDSPNGLASEAVDEVKTQWTESFSKPEHAGKVVFSSGKLSFTQLQTNFRELQTQELSRELLSYVRASFGISAEALGDLSSGDRSKAEAARYQLADTVIAPRVEFLRQCLQKWLLPLIDAEALLHFSDPRPQERDRVQSLMTNSVTAPAFTMNEARQLAGYAPLPELDGLHLLPMPGQFAPSQGQDGQPASPTPAEPGDT